MQLKIGQAVNLARTRTNARTVDWLSRVLGFEADGIAFPYDQTQLLSTAGYLERSMAASAFEIRVFNSVSLIIVINQSKH